MAQRTKRRSTKSIIAATYGTDISEVGDHYQREKGVYVMGDVYLTCGQKPPRDGRQWRMHADQFWAAASHTILWVSTSGEA